MANGGYCLWDLGGGGGEDLVRRGDGILVSFIYAKIESMACDPVTSTSKREARKQASAIENSQQTHLSRHCGTTRTVIENRGS